MIFKFNELCRSYIQTLFWGSLTLIAYVQNSAPENFSSFPKSFNSLSILWAGSGLPEWIMPLGRVHCHTCCSYPTLLAASSVTVWGSQVCCPPLSENFQTYITRKDPDPLLPLTETWELNNICATKPISCACFLGHSPGWERPQLWCLLQGLPVHCSSGVVHVKYINRLWKNISSLCLCLSPRSTLTA